jgi:type IV pilus assembly protein PilM
MFGLKSNKAVVGLDIGSTAIKAVELRAGTKGKRAVYDVAKIGYEALPRDAIVEGAIVEPAAVVETIKTLFEKSKIGNRDVVISVSGNSVIIKKISLPAMETEELAESIIWEAKHNIPYPYEETHVDYAILKPPPGAQERNLEILLVAVKKDKIDALRSVIHQARKNLEAVEVDAFALSNALEINYPEDFEEKTTALVNIGANVTTLVITEKGSPQLFRDLAIGGAFFLDNIRKDLNLGPDAAESLLRGDRPSGIPAGEIEAVLSLNVKGLLGEIEKTFTFYQAENKREKKIEQIYICGGLAGLPELASAFEAKFETKTVIFDPFRRVQYNEKKLSPVYYQEMASFFGVAVGLATRQKEK